MICSSKNSLLIFKASVLMSPLCSADFHRLQGLRKPTIVVGLFTWNVTFSNTSRHVRARIQSEICTWKMQRTCRMAICGHMRTMYDVESVGKCRQHYKQSIDLMAPFHVRLRFWTIFDIDIQHSQKNCHVPFEGIVWQFVKYAYSPSYPTVSSWLALWCKSPACNSL